MAREITGVEACSVITESVAAVSRFDAAAVMTTDPETHLPAGGLVTGFDTSAHR